MKTLDINDAKQLLRQIILDSFDITDLEKFHNNGFELEINDGHIVNIIKTEV